MKREEESRLAEEIQRRLRAGDPAGDGGDLSPDEWASMRRAVLDTVSDRAAPAATRLWMPVVAAAALIVVAVVVTVRIYAPEVEPAPVTSTEEPPVAVIPEPAPVTESLEVSGPPVESVAPDPNAPRGAVAVAEDTEPPKTQPAVPTVEPRQPRTIRFTTANGTQIIWKLDPDFVGVTGS
jgi:hypothetical protein